MTSVGAVRERGARALAAVVALAVASHGGLASAQCAGVGRPLRVRFVGDPFAPSLRDELIRQLGLIVQPHGLAVCTPVEDEPERPGPEVALALDGAVVHIRVTGGVDPGDIAAPPGTLDVASLPEDAHAFAIARVVDELLQHAAVIAPTPPSTPPDPPPAGEPATDEPHSGGPDADAPPSAPELDESPPATEAGSTVEAWLTARARGAFFSTGDLQLGGALALAVDVDALRVALEVGGGSRPAFAGAQGEVVASTVHATLSAAYRLREGELRAVFGGQLTAGAALFSVRVDDGVSVARDAVGPLLMLGVHIGVGVQLDRHVELELLVEAAGVAVGARAVDDAGQELGRLNDFVVTTALGCAFGGG